MLKDAYRHSYDFVSMTEAAKEKATYSEFKDYIQKSRDNTLNFVIPAKSSNR